MANNFHYDYTPLQMIARATTAHESPEDKIVKVEEKSDFKGYDNDVIEMEVVINKRGSVVQKNPEVSKNVAEMKVSNNEGEIDIVQIDDDREYLLGPQSTFFFQDKLGMTVTSGIVNVKKDTSNLIGISIGGGAPLCPCLYIVQVFDNSPAAKEGTLQSGDELVGVNGQSVKGKTKVEVAKMIQASQDEVNIKYNKLHADPSQGKSLDIILKKVKHRLVENMSSSTADALGLSRAILCNDTLVKRLSELEAVEATYRGLVDHARRVLKAFFGLMQAYKAFGDVFAGIGVREPQPRASEAFRAFGDYHRLMEKNGIQTLKILKPILSDLGTYLNKAIPDTKLTIRKYADAKFEYLSYCLKVKEMDDEEYSYATLQEPLYRVETGNYEYRLILRCRQEARAKFARLRSDVQVKLELLDSKHVQHIGDQLHRFLEAFSTFNLETHEIMSSNNLFPIEMDLAQSAFQYNSTATLQDDEDDDDELIQAGEEALDLEKGDIILGMDNEFGVTEPAPEAHRSVPPALDDILSELSSLQINQSQQSSIMEPATATLIGFE